MARKRALVVDDSKSARVVLSRMLEKYDIEVDLADSAEQAIEYLNHDRPDAIFMDHLMPGMDGLQAIRVIKGNPQTAMIPIMMYTSQEGELYVSQARALGAMGVLPKQVRPVDVSKVLYELHLLPDRRDFAGGARRIGCCALSSRRPRGGGAAGLIGAAPGLGAPFRVDRQTTVRRYASLHRGEPRWPRRPDRGRNAPGGRGDTRARTTPGDLAKATADMAVGGSVRRGVPDRGGVRCAVGVNAGGFVKIAGRNCRIALRECAVAARARRSRRNGKRSYVRGRGNRS